MDFRITIHVPFKVKKNDYLQGVTVYTGVKGWWFSYGAMDYQKWFRICGVMFTLGHWKWFPVEFSFNIQ